MIHINYTCANIVASNSNGITTLFEHFKSMFEFVIRKLINDFKLQSTKVGAKIMAM